MAVTVARGATFDSRVFVPYIKVAFAAQSLTTGSVVNIAAPFYIAGGVSPVWTMTAVPGLAINSSTGQITGTVTTVGVTTFQITCTNAQGAVSTTPVNFTVTAQVTWSTPSAQTVDNTYPNTITGLVAANLSDPGGVVSNVTVEDDPASGNDLVATGKVSLSYPADILTVISNPGGKRIRFRASGASALADWNARSTANGVLKSLRFQDSTNVFKYSSAPAASQFVTPAERALAAQNIFYRAGDGIIGDGCMEHFYPAGLNRFISWNLPLAPLSTDFNQPQLPTITDPTSPSQPYWWPLGYNQQRKGFFAHDNYVGPLVANQTWPGIPQGDSYIIGNEFWIQYRIKFSASSFTQQTAKVMWIDTNINNNDAAFIYDMITGAGHGGEFHMYTNYGGNTGASFTRAWNAELSDIQGEVGSGSKFQTGGAFENTCLLSTSQKGYPATNCWTFIPEEWVTLNFHIKPGLNAKATQNANNLLACSNPVFDPFRNTVAEVFAARPGATTWTKIWGRNDFVLSYWSSFGDLQNGWSSNDPPTSKTPFGFSQVKFSSFNGGLDTTAPTADIWRRFDQFIISTLEPALPAV